MYSGTNIRTQISAELHNLFLIMHLCTNRRFGYINKNVIAHNPIKQNIGTYI